jgi:hypothetical protein
MATRIPDNSKHMALKGVQFFISKLIYLFFDIFSPFNSDPAKLLIIIGSEY